MDYLEGIKKIEDNSIDLLLTDPPYLHVKGGQKSKKYNTGTWGEDSLIFKELSDFNKDKIYELLDVTIPKMKKVNMFIFCSRLQLVHYFEYIAEHKKLKYDLLVWDKVKYSMKSTKFYTSDIEYIVRIYEAGVSLNKVLTEDGSKSDINYYLKRKAFEQPRGKHVTMKPVNLIKNLIITTSNEQDLVLDTFMGSGTTALACLETNRNFIGFEVSPDYWNLSNENIKNKEEELGIKYNL